MTKANKVEGCFVCGKPCALVGDEIPVDGMCPWCRMEESPGVMALWFNDQVAEKQLEPITKVEGRTIK